MLTLESPPLGLTAGEVMSREVVTLPRSLPMKDAARLLRRGGAEEAVVVDDDGRCAGLLSPAGFFCWVEEGCPAPADDHPAACRFQTRGELLTGEPAVICTLAPGSCPLQVSEPTTAGRHTSICLDPRGLVNDWQQPHERGSAGRVGGYLKVVVPTVAASAPCAEVARRMGEGAWPRAYVLDEHRRPVGVVTSAALLAPRKDEG